MKKEAPGLFAAIWSLIYNPYKFKKNETVFIINPKSCLHFSHFFKMNNFVLFQEPSIDNKVGKITGKHKPSFFCAPYYSVLLDDGFEYIYHQASLEKL